eukprot:TRINITY_DN110730_c0_g1_i1.p1 TRINITY_DN110730_c0_g1~~TRINITY_DN110730_c0_g1_i1.p1  ORF type:complete len:487 (-),score=73.86 TRINITY_DN110730_c0_g1_i1:563-1963(-)
MLGYGPLTDSRPSAPRPSCAPHLADSRQPNIPPGGPMLGYQQNYDLHSRAAAHQNPIHQPQHPAKPVSHARARVQQYNLRKQANAGKQANAASQPAQSRTGGITTVMLRNIPNKVAPSDVVDELNKGYHAEFDFLYVPLDLQSKHNPGYCFINFRTSSACARFVTDFHGVPSQERFPGNNSNKVLEVASARLQGADENIVSLLGKAQLLGEISKCNPDYRPLVFNPVGTALPLTGGIQDNPIAFTQGVEAGKEAKKGSKSGIEKKPKQEQTLAAGESAPDDQPASDAVDAQPNNFQGVFQEGVTTTLCIKHLAKDTTKQTLQDLLDGAGFKCTYDFIFVRADKSKQGCAGFAFVNFVSSDEAAFFKDSFSDICEGVLQPGKPVAVLAGINQGLAKLISAHRQFAKPDFPVEYQPSVFEDGFEVDFPEQDERPAEAAQMPKQSKKNRKRKGSQTADEGDAAKAQRTA